MKCLSFFKSPLACAFLAALLCACSSTSMTSNRSALSPQQISAIVANPNRNAADLKYDPSRKPQELLLFLGASEGMVAVDLSTGGGYTAELLARAVGPTGKVYGQSTPRTPQSPPLPAGRLPSPETLAERSQRSSLGNLASIVSPFSDPIPSALQGQLDLVTLIFNYHDITYANVDRNQMNQAILTALKPGGAYVIADYSGRPGTGISEGRTLHRIDESTVRKEVESVGFQYVAEGGFLRNPSDPRDQKDVAPPQTKDRFIVKFIKPL